MNYKHFLIFLIFLIICSSIYSQDNIFNGDENAPKVSVGYLHLYNNLNADSYFGFKYSYASDNGTANLGGLNIKLDFPTKYQSVDVTIGTLIMKELDEVDFGHINPSTVNAHDYNINGGGVYLGISPKIKGKYIGLTSDFGIGVFSFKEYVSIVNNTTMPFVDEHNLKASYGLGALSSVGFYLKAGRFGISPSVNAIFTGSSSASFLFLGFNFPITFYF